MSDDVAPGKTPRGRGRSVSSAPTLAGLSGDWHDRFEADSARAAIAKQISARIAETTAAVASEVRRRASPRAMYSGVHQAPVL